MQKFTSTKLFKFIIISAFFAALIVFNPARIFNPLRSIFVVVFSPFEKVFYSSAIGFENAKEFIGSIGQLKQENQQLIKKNQELVSENAMFKDVQNENALLREQLNLLPRDHYDLISSFVIGQDPNGMGNWLEIDKGSNDGIVRGMAVVFSKGVLVGRIDQVSPTNSKVVLLTNPQSMVNVATLQKGTKGVIKGEYGLGIIFDMILQTDSINVGDEVVTSGIGGDIPKGLYVGTVEEIHPSEDHLFQQAVVTSPLQASRLQIVFVIKDIK